MFVGKGELLVFKDVPEFHLTTIGTSIVVDASQLATDLRSAYDTNVKPCAQQGHSQRANMETRLAEMYREYGIQGQRAMTSLTLPTKTVDAASIVGVSGGKTLLNLVTRSPGT